MLATTHPHNAYLQALLDMGIVGLVLLCAYFVHVWRGFRALSVSPDLTPTLRGFYLGAAAGLVGFLIAAVADGSLAPRPEQAFLWLAIGMMYGQRSKTGDAAVAERRR
jgi:O-antigen ligase